MKTNTGLALALLGSTLLLPLAANADVPGEHPAYLHAMTDLREARWNLEHRPSGPRVTAHEVKAIAEIDLALHDVKKAARSDGKNVDNRPADDAGSDRPGRLHRAQELLAKARADIGQEEDNRYARNEKRSALKHIDVASRSVEHAIMDVERHKE
jgi:hypothetical protein